MSPAPVPRPSPPPNAQIPTPHHPTEVPLTTAHQRIRLIVRSRGGQSRRNRAETCGGGTEHKVAAWTNTYRHPAVVANQAATIDQMSEGRFVLGIGAGWQVNEHEVYGIELPPVRERLARFEEACQVIKGLLTEQRTTFDGKYYQLTNAPLEPKPANLPILIGAAGEKVALGIVATYADEWNHWGRPELAAHKGEVFAEHCEKIGRDPNTVRRSAQTILEVVVPGDTEAIERKERLEGRGMHVIMGSAQEVLDTVAQYPAAGIDEILVPDAFLGSGNRRFDALERLREEVLAKI